MPNNNYAQIGYMVAVPADKAGGQVQHFDNNVFVDTNRKYTSGQTASGSWQRNVERTTAIRSGEVKYPQGTTRYMERVQILRDRKVEHTPSSSASSNRLENRSTNNAVASYKKSGGGGGGGGGGKRSSGSGNYQSGGGSRRNGGSSHYY